jgi:hypothetical protein
MAAAGPALALPAGVVRLSPRLQGVEVLWSRKRKGSTPLAGLRDALFADASLGEVASRATSPSDDPWSHFAAAQQALSQGDKIGAIQELRRVEEMEGLETHLYLQAWHCLRTLGELPPETIAREVKASWSR